MQVREQSVAVRPRVRAPRAAVVRGERCDGATALDPPAQDDVGLHDVDAPAQDEIACLGHRAHHLSRSDADVRRAPERRVPVDVRRRQRLLEPVDVETLELAREGDGRVARPARREVAGHPPALVRVDHELEIGPDGLAHRLDRRQVEAPVLRVEAELDRTHAGVAELDAAPNALLGRDELARRRVRAHALACSAEELPERDSLRPSGEIPDGDLEDPVAAVVEVDALDDPVDDVVARRVDAEEEAREEPVIREPVSARVALDTVVRAHDRDRRLLLRPRHGVPRRVERRVERIPVAPGLDRRDLHAASVAAVERVAKRVAPLDESGGRVRVPPGDARPERLPRRSPAREPYGGLVGSRPDRSRPRRGRAARRSPRAARPRPRRGRPARYRAEPRPT